MNATIYYKNIFGDNKMTKYKILEILRENKDNFISGEILSRKLNVSRTAVWKGIKSLKEKGYLIEGINNKGGLQEIIKISSLNMRLKKI